jgi:cytidine deaminase
MSYLLDILFIKRFCLPFDSDIQQYENGIRNVSSCICGQYNHVSCIFEGKYDNFKKVKILCFGANQMGDIDGNTPGIHAEHSALSKLIPLKNKKRLKSINLCVIRLTQKNKIQSSKPCNNCIEIMKKMPQKIGYKIENIYYSNSDGAIIKTKLKYLDLEEKHFSKFYKNQNNYKNFTQNTG